MAWKWRATSDTSNESGTTIAIDYVDDASPATVLLSRDFQFDPGTSKVEAVIAIRKYGRLTKAARDQAVALGDSFAPGEEGFV